MLAAATPIFLLVMALLALAFRRRPAAQAAAVAGERVWIVGLGLAFPVAVLAALLVYGLWVGERLLPRDAPDIARVHAEARQWSWTFAYDDVPGRTTENVLHIPAGRAVDVSITTADVIHSFWVPRLAGKLDAIPGHVNVLRLQADEPGSYLGISAEFSGPGYGRHVFTVVAHAPDAWQQFLEADE